MAYKEGDKYGQMTLNAAQAARLNSQASQMSGQTTTTQAQAARDASMAASLAKSTTINRYTSTDAADQAAQQAINTKYNLPSNTGLTGTPVTRTQVLETKTPTPANPMIEVPTQGANANKPTVITSSYNQPVSQFTTRGEYKQTPSVTGQQYANTQNQLAQKQRNMTAEDYFNLNPYEQKELMNANAQDSQQQIGGLYDESLSDYDAQIQKLNAQKEAKRAEIEAANSAKQAEYEARLNAQKSQAEAAVERAAQSRLDAAQTNLAFSGFGRSTKAADISSDIMADKQAQIAELESNFSASVAEYKSKLLDSVDDQLSGYDKQIESVRSDREKTSLEKLKAQSEVVKELIKNDPTNPANMLDSMKKMSDMRIEWAKYDRDVKKDAQDSAQKTLENAVKYGYVPEFGTAEEAANFASNINVPLSDLHNVINKAIEKSQEEKTKYQFISDGQGGMYIGNPSTGSVVGQYDMFGNYKGASIGSGSSAPPYVPNTPNATINSTNAAKMLLGGTMTQRYGVAVDYESNGKHNGLDIVLPGGKNAKVNSPVGGTVIKVEKNGSQGYGNSVIIRTNDGKEVRVSHLDNINVQQGQTLAGGEILGNQGNSGFTRGKTGIHVDLRVMQNGKYIDPKPYLQQIANTPAQTNITQANSATSTSTMSGGVSGSAQEIYNGLILAGDTPTVARAKAVAASSSGQPAYSDAEIARVKADSEKKNAKPSDGERQANLYASRLQQAEDVFSSLENEGYNLADQKYISERATPTSVFGVSLGGMGKSNEMKRQEQAERNFINATLRRESGAAISPSEFESAALQYFPQPGDTAEVLLQKKENRRLAIAGFKQQAGNATEIYSSPVTKASGKYSQMVTGSNSNISDNEI